MSETAMGRTAHFRERVGGSLWTHAHESETVNQMRWSLAAVVLASLIAAGCGADESPPTASASEPSASIRVAPQNAATAKNREIRIEVESGRPLDVFVLVHPGLSKCGRTWTEESDNPLTVSILEATTRPGARVLNAGTFTGQPGAYRVCVYLETVSTPSTRPRLVLVETVTFDNDPMNRLVNVGQIGPWRVNQKFVKRPGFEGIWPYPQEPRETACPQSFRDATRIDMYGDGVSVAWIKGVLAGVRTDLNGDRTEDGFVIGSALLESVRARYPNLPVIRGGGPDYDERTGDWRLISVVRRTASGPVELRHWFDRHGVLVAIETNSRPC